MKSMLVAGAAFGALLFAAPSEAQTLSTLKKCYDCAKSGVQTYGTVLAEVAEKAALAGEVAAKASACTAAGGGSPVLYIAATGGITAVKLISPESVPTGQCMKAVKSTVSRPLISGVGELLPSGSLKNGLMSQLESDLVREQLWDTISTTVPGFSGLAIQLDCACTTIDNGLKMTDIRAVVDAVKSTSSKCAGALDALGLGWINKIDDTLEEVAEQTYSELSGLFDEFVSGQTDPQHPSIVYDLHYGRWEKHAIRSGATFDTYNSNKWYIDYQPNFMIAMADTFECRKYYDDRKHSYTNANKLCSEMETRYRSIVEGQTRAKIAEAEMLGEISRKFTTFLNSNLAWRVPKEVGGMNARDVLPSLGAIKCSEEDFNFRRLWACEVTGIYDAAREMLAVIDNSNVVINTLLKASDVKVGGLVLSKWDKNKKSAEAGFLSIGYANTGDGTWPCGIPAQPLGQACATKMSIAFDDLCYIPMAMVAYENIGFNRMNKARSACLEGLAKIRTSAKEIATLKETSGRPVNAYSLSSVCSSFAAPNEAAACQSIIAANALDCQNQAMDMVVKGDWKGKLTQCIAEKRTALSTSIKVQVAIKVGVDVQKPPVPSGPIQVPPVVKLPGRGG